jgi:hypothetical protein
LGVDGGCTNAEDIDADFAPLRIVYETVGAVPAVRDNPVHSCVKVTLNGAKLLTPFVILILHLRL